jgi:hypothetical protein
MQAPKEPQPEELSTPQLWRRRETLKKRRARINAEIDAEMAEIDVKLQSELDATKA